MRFTNVNPKKSYPFTEIILEDLLGDKAHLLTRWKNMYGILTPSGHSSVRMAVALLNLYVQTEIASAGLEKNTLHISQDRARDPI